MFIKKRLTYANVAATLALVLSMSGGAIAASHYLITSTKQISPKVIKQLKGKAGPAGPAGIAGLAGKEGPAGKEGLTGKDGKEGKEGPRGPSDVWQAGDGSFSSEPPLAVSVPAGSYIVQAKTVIAASTSGDSVCTLTGGSGSDKGYGATQASGIEQMTITNLETTTLTTPGTIELTCSGAAGTSFFYSKLTATAVGTIH